MFSPDGNPIAIIPSPRLAGGGLPCQSRHWPPALHASWGPSEGLGTEIRLGVTVDSLDDDGDGVSVAFNDGTTADYDLVIGADGVYSATRAMLFPDAPEPEFTGQAVWRYNFPRPDDCKICGLTKGGSASGWCRCRRPYVHVRDHARAG